MDDSDDDDDDDDDEDDYNDATTADPRPPNQSGHRYKENDRLLLSRCGETVKKYLR